MREPLIRLVNVEKFYQQGNSRFYVLRRVNLDIQDGDFVAIMGPSGAGKSTLLHVLGMHDSAWTGEYHLMGHPIHQIGRKDRMELYKKHFGFVFQSYHLLDDLTVSENLESRSLTATSRKRSGNRSSADMLDRFQIVGKKDLFPNQLSGGQQQLVGVARAVIASPKSFWRTSQPAICTRAKAWKSWRCSRS